MPNICLIGSVTATEKVAEVFESLCAEFKVATVIALPGVKKVEQVDVFILQPYWLASAGAPDMQIWPQATYSETRFAEIKTWYAELELAWNKVMIRNDYPLRTVINKPRITLWPTMPQGYWGEFKNQ